MHAMISGHCRTTMHKKSNISSQVAIPATISLNVNSQSQSFNGPTVIEANCWLNDGQRNQFLQLPHDVLLAIHQVVEEFKKKERLVEMDRSKAETTLR